MPPDSQQNNFFGCPLVGIQAVGKQSLLIVEFEFMHKNPRQVTLFFFTQGRIIRNIFNGLIHDFFVFRIKLFCYAGERRRYGNF